MMEGNRFVRRQLLPAVVPAVIVHLLLLGVCFFHGIAERTVTLAGPEAVLAFSLADLVTVVQDGSRQSDESIRETLRPAKAASPPPQPETVSNAVPLMAISKTMEKRKVSHLRKPDAGLQASSSPSTAVSRGEVSAPMRQPTGDVVAAPAKWQEAVVAARPRYRDNPSPEYPQLARRRGWQGKVLLDVTVLADGSVGNIRLDQSSSYDLLDRAALMTVRSWLFTPEHRDGRPVEAKVKVPVRFALNE